MKPNLILEQEGSIVPHYRRQVTFCIICIIRSILAYYQRAFGTVVEQICHAISFKYIKCPTGTRTTVVLLLAFTAGIQCFFIDSRTFQSVRKHIEDANC